jgi:uncharacterized membrane protein HdeD (DUF308 family)
MAPQTAATTSPAPGTVKNKFWFYLLGVVLILLGFAAIGSPFVTTIAAKIALGWLVLIGGVIQVAHAFGTRGWSEFLLGLLAGAAFVIVGAWLAFFPLTGILTLTLLLAVTFIFQGILELGMAFRLRPNTGWLWMLIAGIVAIVVGLMLIADLPGSATWAIGFLVGINLIMSGVAYLLLPAASKSVQGRVL